MLQQGSLFKIADNSGAKTAKCIKVLGGYKKKTSKIGDIVIVSVQELRNKFKITSKVKKGEIYRALIIRTKKNCTRKDGTVISFSKKTRNSNSAILINKKGNPIGTRMSEPVPSMLKKKQLLKLISISPGFIS